MFKILVFISTQQTLTKKRIIQTRDVIIIIIFQHLLQRFENELSNSRNNSFNFFVNKLNIENIFRLLF